MEQSPSWQANIHSAIQEIPRLLWKPTVHYLIHNSPPLIRTWARWIQSTPSHPISLRSIIILSFYLRLCLPSGLFPSRFRTKILYAFLIPLSALYMPCPSHPPWLNHPNNIWWSVQVMKLLITQSSPASRHFLLYRCQQTHLIVLLSSSLLCWMQLT
jgi:hypothetical protein